MPSRIYNLTQTQGALRQVGKDLADTFARLSSGLRIQKASDDPAGLALANQLSQESRVLNQGVRNLNDGVSLLNIADRTVEELQSLTERISELAQQASSGTLSVSQRKAIDTEAQLLSDEFNRIASNTEYNGKNLFNGTFGELRLQSGYGSLGSISSSLGGAIGTGQLGSVSTTASIETVALQDINFDGNIDIFTDSGIELGNGDGTFALSQTYAITAPSELASGDVNSDGYYDLISVNTASTVEVLLGNSDGTVAAAQSYAVGAGAVDVQVVDLNNDGSADIVTADSTDATLSLLMGNSDGTFAARSTIGTGLQPGALAITDMNGDGINDIIYTEVKENHIGGFIDADGVSVRLGNGDGTFQSELFSTIGAYAAPTNDHVEIHDFNNDGILDVAVSLSSRDFTIHLGNGDGSLGAANSLVITTDEIATFSAGDFNGDGIVDLAGITSDASEVSIRLGIGDGSFQDLQNYDGGINGSHIAITDLDGDSVVDIITNQGFFAGTTTTGIGPLLSFSLATQVEAKETHQVILKKIDQLTEVHATISAFQARTNSAITHTVSLADLSSNAASRIRDIDAAKELAQMVRLQILQSANTALQSQASSLGKELVRQLLS